VPGNQRIDSRVDFNSSEAINRGVRSNNGHLSWRNLFLPLPEYLAPVIKRARIQGNEAGHVELIAQTECVNIEIF
jgi:hypothetical protein